MKKITGFGIFRGAPSFKREEDLLDGEIILE